MVNSETKGCPFCGSKVLYEIHQNVDGFEMPFMFCDSCKAMFTVEGSEDWVTPVDDGMDKLRVHWNMRADDIELDASKPVRKRELVKAFHYAEMHKKSGGHVSWDGVDAVLNFGSITDAAHHFGVTAGYISQMLECGEIRQRGKLRGYKFEYQNGSRKRRKCA